MTDTTAASSSRNVAAAATWRSNDDSAPGNGTAYSTPPQAPRTTAAESSAPAATSQLSKDEIADMLKRGRDLISAGDVASARLILTLVADAGDAEASLLLARTYDAAALSDLKALGVAADQAKARAWYMKAAERGSLAAQRHLQ